MNPRIVALAVALAVAAPAPAQVHSIPGMAMPAEKPAAKAKPRAQAPHDTAKPATPGIDEMDISVPSATSATGAMPAMSMPDRHNMAEMAGMDTPPSGTALPAGHAPAPAPPTDRYADRFFPAAENHRAHGAMMVEQGGRSFYRIVFNLAEYQVRDGKDGYRWDGEGWFGSDINRLTLKSEGEGAFREGVASAEIQALYSRAIGPYFNLQAGVRHDFQPTPARTYGTVGLEGLAPYMFEVEGVLFVSNKGDLLGRLEGTYDQYITQRVILQPRIELNLAAQDVPDNRIGAGLTDAELGLRLRYEFTREFAPYVGVSYEAKAGGTADFAHAAGKGTTSTSFVAGLHFWL